MINELHAPKPSATRNGVKRRRTGWSPERRARQAALIRRVKPWQRSTGPKSVAGKACCAMNALKHGRRSRAYRQKRRFTRELVRRARHVLRIATKNLVVWRAFLNRPACPPIKYKPCHAVAKRRRVRVPGTVMASERGKWFRALTQERRMLATHLAPALKEDHRWPSASR